MASIEFTTESIGNGNIILVENPGANLRFGDTFEAEISSVEASSDEWEVPRGTYLGNGEFSRDSIIISGANNGYVNFSSGLKSVVIQLTPEYAIRNSSNVTITNNAIAVSNVNANVVFANATVSVGANVIVNTTAVSVGANVIANTIALLVGSVTVNTTAILVGANIIANTTAVSVGANVVVNTTSIRVPNTGLITATSKTTNGYTYVSGGILLQWGWVATNATSGDITFPIAFPNAIYSQQVTANSALAGNLVSIIAANQTTMNVRSTSTAAASNSYWLAVGG